MAVFKIGEPVATRTPGVVVDAGLAPGRHRFRLEVIDSQGRRSAPVEADVLVVRGVPVRPVLTPVLTPALQPVPPLVPIRRKR